MNNQKAKWTEEEDQFLIETVREYMQNGDPKAAAFKMAGEKLSRTPSACRYRWNSVLKKQSLEKSSAPIPANEKSNSFISKNELNLNEIILFLQELNKNNPVENLEREKRDLLEEQESLKGQASQLRNVYSIKKEAYLQTLQQYEKIANLFENARRLANEETKAIRS